MNRQFRRSIKHANRHRVTREPISKHTHKLTPQCCALWVPDARSYVREFSPRNCLLVECVELARLYNEDEASSAALTFREVTGLRVAVRPVYLQHA